MTIIIMIYLKMCTLPIVVQTIFRSMQGVSNVTSYKHLLAGKFVCEWFDQFACGEVEDKSKCDGYWQSRQGSLEYHQQQ